MNPVAIHLSLSPEAERLYRSLPAMPARVMDGMRRALDKENQLTVAHIQQDYLSFAKHGPTSPIGLRVQTNRLRASMRASSAVITGTGVASAIGSNVKYAALHEFGADFERTTKPGKVRLRIDKAGNLLRQADGRLARFARKGHKLAREVSFSGGKTHRVHLPERAFTRRGIADRLSDYERALSRAVIDGLNTSP